MNNVQKWKKIAANRLFLWKQAEALAASRLELLRQYEWINVFIDNGGYGDKWIKQCLCCKSEQDDGHADGCKMAEGLGE